MELHGEKIRLGQKRNKLLRYQAIMAEFDKYDLRSYTVMHIYRKYIRPKFNISRKTLYNVLNTDIEKELQELDQRSDTSNL